ncbi:MAG: hypothetical protein M0R68_06435 [Bacteroidetes bacterium]|nr:hypothetical protein [Bacteroidota bacterium]
MNIRMMILGWCYAIAGCQEFLPSREDPNDYFKTSVSKMYDVFYPNNPSAKRNRLVLYLYIVNNYDDVIQDNIEITGSVELVWNIPKGENRYGIDSKKTMTLSRSNILRAKGYDANTGILTLAPNDTIVLFCPWNFTTNDSTNLMGKFNQRIDYRCQVFDTPGHSAYRKITTEQEFTISASVRLTKKTSTLYFKPFTFSQCFIVPYFSPDPDFNCLTENGIDPCHLIE